MSELPEQLHERAMRLAVLVAVANRQDVPRDEIFMEADSWLSWIGKVGDTIWLTRTQAARRYNVSTRTLDRMSREEGFPVHRKGRLVRYAQRACDEWIEARRAP